MGGALSWVKASWLALLIGVLIGRFLLVRWV